MGEEEGEEEEEGERKVGRNDRQRKKHRFEQDLMRLEAGDFRHIHALLELKVKESIRDGQRH